MSSQSTRTDCLLSPQEADEFRRIPTPVARLSTRLDDRIIWRSRQDNPVGNGLSTRLNNMIIWTSSQDNPTALLLINIKQYDYLDIIQDNPTW